MSTSPKPLQSPYHSPPKSPPERPMRNVTPNTLHNRAEEYDGRFERVAMEALSDLEAFSRAGRARQPSTESPGMKKYSFGFGFPLKQVPKFGVDLTRAEDEEMSAILESIDQWGLDVHTIDRLSGGHPLVVVMFAIFKKRGLLDFLALDEYTFLTGLFELEKQYQLKPTYHNARHAADVTHTVHVILNGSALQSQCKFSDLEITAILFAAAIHDVGHPGVNNGYVSKHEEDYPSACKYEDGAVLECHSLALTFRTLQNEYFDIFANLNRKQRATIRKIVIDAVLTTDMAKHDNLSAELERIVKQKRESTSGYTLSDEYTPRIRILQCILHCADLSNPTKPLNMYKEWAGAVMEEFWAQGDKERAKDEQISFLCDRYTTVPEAAQHGFISFVVTPLYTLWAEFVDPDARLILAQLGENKEWYNAEKERVQRKKNGSDGNGGGDGNGKSPKQPKPDHSKPRASEPRI